MENGRFVAKVVSIEAKGRLQRAVRYVLIIEIIEGSKKEEDGRGIEETKSRKPMERGLG